ncbi:hydantoinase/carbamoylase family amidase [Patulibacter defluvii]|uniref:hydantoinase/carbamoylase family amidase n=1 Tax=Patulibacter defluvii TaxID=3095358 RepID=UPI002A755365|nr:hydantoinase/carbamoylase family amidase [Patulibacter sp. DM4]
MTESVTDLTAVTAADLTERLAGLDPIGVGPAGVTRLPWSPEDEATGRWFADQAAAIGLRVERDAAGNRWALPAGEGPWWTVGSHLDSVRDGGRFDGPLGVAVAFAVAARCRRPLAVVSFADEEGARFNTPTFGSRALAGLLDVDDALVRTDDTGTTMAAAMAAAGVDPEGLRETGAALDRIAGFVELHIDQSRDVDAAGVPFAVASGLAARRRLAIELRGTADHAGTTPMDERRDALAVAARIVVAALELADERMRVTTGRLVVEPNARTTIASRVDAWLDLRAPAPELLDDFERRWRAAAVELATAGRVDLAIRRESRSGGAVFDPELRARLRGDDGIETLCFAGHDAGNVAIHRPAAMVLVRNPTGISHSPDEEVALEDAAAGATRILRVLDELA